MSRRSQILRLEDKLQVQRNLQEKLDTRRPWRIQFKGILGDGDGNVAVDPDEPRLVYVRTEGRAVIRNVLNLSVSNIPDMHVLVGYTDWFPNRLQILGPAAGDYGYALGSIGTTENHHQQHEFRRDGQGGNDIVWVNTHQITDGLVYPPTTSGLAVNTHKCWYAYGTSSHFFAGTEDSNPVDGAGDDIGDAIAALAANEACWILVYIDTTTDPHELAIEIGDSFPATLFPPEGSDALPDFPYGSVPLAGLYVEDDDTAITWDNIYDQRLFPTGVAGVVGATQHELLDGSVHPDTVDVDPTRGDIILADSTPEWNVLAAGAANLALRMDGAGEDPEWGNLLASIVDFTPAVLTDWDGDADPGYVDDALDQLAERTVDLEIGQGALIFSQVESVTVANSVAEATLLGAGRGAKEVSAGILDVGTVIRISANGYLSTTGLPTLDIDVDLGGSEVCSTGAFSTATVTDAGWELEVEITCISTGATGEVVTSGTFCYGDGNKHDLVKTTVTVVDTTAALSIDLTVQWGTADAGNTITCQLAPIELMRADVLAVAAPGPLVAAEA
jgi:hypothetical protein